MPKIVDHEERRAEIVEVTAQLIASGGIEAATIREIAAASGFSKGIIEHYFVNKNELIDAALAWANQRYYERVGQATNHLQGLAALKARIEAMVPLGEATRVEWRIRLVFWSLAAIEPGLRKQQAQRTQLTISHFASDIAEAQESGDLPAKYSPETLARLIFHAISGLSCAILHNPRAYKREFVQQEIDHIIGNLG